MVVMHWILEVGNTRVKWAAFDADAPLSYTSTHCGSRHHRRLLCARALENSGGRERLCVGVGKWQTRSMVGHQSFLSRVQTWRCIAFAHRVTSPETLGLDRVANVWAVVQGASEDPSQPWLIVDAGTCVTMDLLHQGTHMGGTISPGLQMRLASMAQGTAVCRSPDLMAVPPSLRQATAMGSNTPTALLAGAVGGLVAEIEGRWAALRQEVPNLGLILTGGDAVHLELRGIRPKFADAHLTLKGHHALLRHFHDVS